MSLNISHSSTQTGNMMVFHGPYCIHEPSLFYSLWLNDAIWCHRILSTFVQVMASHLFGTKPLPELKLSSRHLGTKSSEIWIIIQDLSFNIMQLKILLVNLGHLFWPQYIKGINIKIYHKSQIICVVPEGGRFRLNGSFNINNSFDRWGLFYIC